MKPVFVSKRQKPTEEDLAVREEYKSDNSYMCEICFKDTDQIHHRYKQQKVYWEHPDNYVLLCQWDCHRLAESNVKQFEREIKINDDSAFMGSEKKHLFEYLNPDWRELRDKERNNET